MKNRQAIQILILLLICLSGGICLFLNWEQFKIWPLVTPTSVLAFTLTPTSTNTLFIARVNIDIPCRLGTGAGFDLITTIPQGRDVMVIGDDGKLINSWFLVRWGGFQDCWVESIFLTLDFDNSLLAPISTPLLFTYTPTPTTVSAITSPPFIATTKFDLTHLFNSKCRSGPSENDVSLTKIPPDTKVEVLNKNNDQGEWFLIKWDKLPTRCWIDSSLLNYDFDSSKLSISIEIIPEPPTAIPIKDGGGSNPPPGGGDPASTPTIPTITPISPTPPCTDGPCP